MSHTLRHILISSQPEDSIDVVFVLNNDTEFLQSKKQLYRLLNVYEAAQVVVVRIKAKTINQVLKENNIQFSDVAKKPIEELTTGSLDITANKINYAHHIFPTLTGEGITASIKEQRFDTSDIDYRGRYVNSGVAAPGQTTHAAIMATMLAGAGNSSPFARGAAPGAIITSSDFSLLLPDADSVYQRFTISIQNHSYGTVLEHYYGAGALAYDVSVKNNPSLLHVFSSGNRGDQAPNDGIYSGLQGFSNFSGNEKAAKNVLTVGAIDSFYRVAVLSSKGPTYDGRVKPELVAFGQDGSSGAAALVSGTAALLQQAYKLKYNSLPPASLIKAILLNSADDVGPKGIDFFSGYGSLNAFAALKTATENRFVESRLAHEEIKSFSITVPPDVVQLKVTIAWTDEAAAVNARKALVNDLDAVLKLPATGERWLPWVLSSVAHSDSLLLPAQRKIDTLNNVEQITIDHPEAGNYILEVKGTHVTASGQPFSLAYQLDSINHFFFTYPTATDPVIAGKSNVLRWQSNNDGKGTLSIMYDDSAQYSINESIDLTQKYFNWKAPDTTVVARLQLSGTSLPANTSDSFVISSATNLQVGFNCLDSFLLFWKTLETREYQLYQLGAKYLEPLRTTNDTFTLINKGSSSSLYYSVAPLVKGKAGLRSYTVNYTLQGVECYFRTFYLQAQNRDRADFTALLGTAFNVAEIMFQKLWNNQFVTLKAILDPNNTSFVFTDSSLTQGVNTYRLQIKLSNGTVLNSHEIRTYYLADLSTIVYPNPAKHGEPVNIITDGASETRIEVYNAQGAFLFTMPLRNTLSQIPAHRLSKGFYFIRIVNNDGKVNTLKQVVY